MGQKHRTELPIFQRDGRVNRLVNIDTLASDDIIPEDEYRRRFDLDFGTRPEQQEDAAVQICGGSDMHDSERSGEGVTHACSTHGTLDDHSPTHACDARQERAAADNARAVKRNQKWLDQQRATDEVLFHKGDTVLVHVPQRCRTKFHPANSVGRIRSVMLRQ